jgi:hypothetical protein
VAAPQARSLVWQYRAVDFTTAPSIKIGSTRYSDVQAKITPWSNGDLEGAVGIGFMDRLSMVLDVRAGKFWLAARARVASSPAKSICARRAWQRWAVCAASRSTVWRLSPPNALTPIAQPRNDIP